MVAIVGRRENKQKKRTRTMNYLVITLGFYDMKENPY